MKLFNAIAAAAVIGASCTTALPANASILITLTRDFKSMTVCNDSDPYIYAYNEQSWNKAYSTSSFTRNADGKISNGQCQLTIIDTVDKYQDNVVAGYKVMKGYPASEMASMGWKILFDKAKPNPSKFNNPRSIASACMGQLDEIPIKSIKSFCFK